MVWLHRYAWLLVVATLILVAAGGMVTSTNSGLSVPDWPTTYGYQMFSFPLSGMVGGIFYEHGHRLIASAVGMLTIGLVIFLWRAEPRRWVRRLGYLALAAVVVQGTLGGLTVLFFLPDAISISHAGLAQIFFALTVSIALVTSAEWHRPVRPPVNDDALGRLTVTLTAAVYCQILLGATMRHTGAGLAIPDFPLSYGQLIPPFWNTAILIHFAHRLGAVLVASLVLMVAWRIRAGHRSRQELVRPSWFLLATAAVQITLGAFVVLTGKNEVINTLHVATGALVFGTTVFLTLRTFRIRLDQPGTVRVQSFGPIKHEA